MEESLEYALIAFINSKPEGNLLRDIAIRTLKDRQALKNPKYIENRAYKRFMNPSTLLFKRHKARRILPSIKYKKLRICGHNWIKRCENI